MNKNKKSLKVVETLLNSAKFLVGQAGFEPTAPTTPRWCATKLRYCPFINNIDYCIISRHSRQVII
jgi:hypothetical protein